MINKEFLIKQIIYRATHRGSKEMDILLGQFAKQHIKDLSIEELKDLNEIMSIEDNLLYEWYFNKINNKKIVNNKISHKLRNFKL
jgi:antitoxin CptB|tara:strand:+ start:2490 stop:2744 length:255 start_codon:yes stop_codon:yes gene_type:complete